MLDEVLLRCLRRNPAHGRGVQLDEDFIADLRFGIVFRVSFFERCFRRRVGHVFDHGFDLEEFNLAEFCVEARLDVAFGTEGTARRGMHHLLDRVDDDRFVDPFFLGDLLDDPIQINLHSRLPSALVTRAAFSKSVTKIVLIIRSLYVLERNRHPAMARLIVEFDPLPIHLDQLADKRLLSCVRMMSSNFHALAAYGGKMLKLTQRPIQSR